MRVISINKITKEEVEFSSIYDFLDESLSTDDFSEWLTEIYRYDYPLPPCLEKVITIGELIEKHAMEWDWNLLWQDRLDYEAEAFLDELDYTESNGDGSKTIEWGIYELTVYEE